MTPTPRGRVTTNYECGARNCDAVKLVWGVHPVSGPDTKQLGCRECGQIRTHYHPTSSAPVLRDLQRRGVSLITGWMPTEADRRALREGASIGEVMDR